MEILTTVGDLSNLRPQLVDVRTPSEFAGGHIAGAINVPLDQIEARVADVAADGPVVLVCKAGTRARMAAGLIAPCRANVTVLDGGMDAWYRAGRPVVVSSRSRWSLERQVRLVAGLVVIVGVLAAWKFDPRWIFLSGFIGLGLAFAGATDFCPMGVLLGRMPWNRNSKLEAIRDSRTVSCVVKD